MIEYALNDCSCKYIITIKLGWTKIWRIDIDLLDAIVKKNKALVESLIAKGANPFATLSDKKGSSNLFVEAINIGYSSVIDIILKHALKIRSPGNEPIDLRKQVFVENKGQMNLFQYACMNSGIGVQKAIYEYAKLTGQHKHILEILNTKIILIDSYGNKSEEYLSTALVQSLSKGLITSNICATDKSSANVVKIGQFVGTWVTCENEAELQGFDDTVEITWKGAISSLGFLISLGLDTNNVHSGIYSFKSLVSFMNKWSADPKDWDAFKSLLIVKNIKFISEPSKSTDGKMYVYATITNKLGKCPRKFKITFDFEAMNRLVNPEQYPDLLKDSLLAKRLDTVEAKVDSLSERILEDVRASLADQPNPLHCFNYLQPLIEGALNASPIAKSGRFPIKPTSLSARVVLNAQNFACAAGQISGFSSIATAITGCIVHEVTQSQARKEVNNSITAMEGKIVSKVATQLAVLLTERAMATYGNNIPESVIIGLFVKVKAHVSDSAQLQSFEQLIMHLFQEATKSLPAPRKLSDGYHSSTSAGSSPKSIPSQNSWQLAAFSALSDSDDGLPVKAKKKKTLFSMMPGYSCLRPAF